MSKQKAGYNNEHGIGNEIYERTDGQLIPLGTGYNNGPTSAIDMLVDDGENVHVFEFKKTSNDAFSLQWDPDDSSDDDLYELCRFCVEYPRPTYPYVGVRFNNRQLIVFKLYVDNWPDTDETLSNAVKFCPVEAKVTHADNLRVYKPETGDWPSQSDGDDIEHLLDRIGFSL